MLLGIVRSDPVWSGTIDAIGNALPTRIVWPETNVSDTSFSGARTSTGGPTAKGSVAVPVAVSSRPHLHGEMRRLIRSSVGATVTCPPTSVHSLCKCAWPDCSYAVFFAGENVSGNERRRGSSCFSHEPRRSSGDPGQAPSEADWGSSLPSTPGDAR